MVDRVVVPCAGCTACCRLLDVYLEPERGDEAALYRTGERYGRPILERREDGSCVYLRGNECAIRDVAPFPPIACRDFDCAKFYHDTSAEGRANLVSGGVVSGELFVAAEERMKR